MATRISSRDTTSASSTNSGNDSDISRITYLAALDLAVSSDFEATVRG
eukprot:CAMPEP_0184519770 /NCGR_PEP_ID=MMETSP0198_2-20121128/6806_1 /TAXON_ID=1112570 /ORGANISM="Thraustochytrium sp., Strain LLF1b" /LENGTH=47 /DNA_ID= /DNA_START= /DNA_END= /DNA_ORIENTATION=